MFLLSVLDVPKKRVSYCRCWKSKKFPLCDGRHKYHNQDNGDKTGPLVLVWNEPEEEVPVSVNEASIIDVDKDMDIKSIDSESPILQSSNGDSNGEFEQVTKMDTPASSDEQLSSLEMIDDNDFDDDTVKVVPKNQ